MVDWSKLGISDSEEETPAFNRRAGRASKAAEDDEVERMSTDGEADSEEDAELSDNSEPTGTTLIPTHRQTPFQLLSK
jgi:hypothetical protein